MKSTTSSHQRSDLYTRVTERVVADLERRARPWLSYGFRVAPASPPPP
jgi:antirestriction protein ArdC